MDALLSAATGTMPSDARRDIERWFVRRGVPQFVEGYSTEQSMDARATPFIAVWIAVWTGIWWAGRFEIPIAWRVIAALASLALVAVAYRAIMAARRRSIAGRPQRFDLTDIGAFAILPAIPTLIVGRDVVASIFNALNVLFGIGVIYLVIAFGLIEIGLWAFGRLRDHVLHIVTLLARTLPVLLILVVFLLFSAEIWEAAHALHGGELAAVLVLLLLIAVLLVVTTFRPEIRRLEAGVDQDLVRVDVEHTPAAAVATPLAELALPAAPLSWLQRLNLDFVVVVNQLLQSFFVALLVMAFLVVFGLIVVPASVQLQWIGGPATVLLEFELLDEVRVLSAELLSVSALLSGIVGLYFTGLALTDAAYKAEHFTTVLGEVRQLLSVRAVYLAEISDVVGDRPTGARQRLS
jgi:hypothetical protein